MASIESEYHRFLSHLAERPAVHEDVHRMANLVLENLQSLAEVGTARRARSARLAPLAIEHLPRMTVEHAIDEDPGDAGPALGRLHQLAVGPFRGFMRQETFDLSHDITLVYGQNGTGKSSFFEALEVAMLGSISEAQVKRVDQQEYCNNARLRRHGSPVLSSMMGGTTQAVRPNETEYRFCFIEKNRLDDFARIAARTPGDQRQLIATLFGVDEFSEFVRGFNATLDENLTLTGRHAAELTIRRNRLANVQQAIDAIPQKLAEVEALEQDLVQRIAPIAEGMTYQICVDWLIGTPQQLGQLAFVQEQLSTTPPVVHEVTRERLQALLEEVFRLQSQWEASSRELAAQASEVSYARLYEAVLALSEGATACPACGTPLGATAQDPFTKAREGLDQLAQLAAIQKQERDLLAQLSEAVRSLWGEIRRVVEAGDTTCPDVLQAAALPPLPPRHDGDWLGVWIAGEQQPWKALLQLAEAIEVNDAEARNARAQLAGLAEERDRLQRYQLEMEHLRTKREMIEQELATAQQTVAQFNEENRELLAAVEGEVPLLAHHQRVKTAYDAFLRELQRYLAALPGQLLQGLGDQALELYNAFNREDTPGDLLQSLRLPLAENGKIEVEFNGEPGARYDALIVLSEGHIKCLGLAILLAKNITQGCPVVIFDDVVNAIDDDHRDGIWRTFFEDSHLDGKQVILTSHAEEFLHRIQQELGADRAGDIKRYKFLPHEGEHQLRVDSDPPTKNYVLLAQRALEADDKREALRQSRPALESLTDRLWTWLGRRGDGRIDIRLAGPRSPWELNNKCTKLRRAIERIADQNEAASQVVVALTALLNVAGTSIEWGYLNGGVHDSQRDHEFDRATVRTVVNAVVALDAALAALRNGR